VKLRTDWYYSIKVTGRHTPYDIKNIYNHCRGKPQMSQTHFDLKSRRVLQITTGVTCGYTWTDLMSYLRHMEFERAALLLRTRMDPLRLYFWSRLLAEIVRGFPQSLQANVRILLQTTQSVSFLILTNSRFIYQPDFRRPKNIILQVIGTNRTSCSKPERNY